MIAVDEFAKLREEVPAFVDGVVDIAQRGRSLGVHMVLAAQTLRNAFTPAIRANTNLRVALRVAEESESQDVIASQLAARIPSGERYRGRAFARTGHSELRQFQTAYVSGRTVDASQRPIEVLPFDAGGTDGRSEGPGEADLDTDNDLTLLAAAASETRVRLGLQAPTPPWLPPLPELVALDSLPAHRESAAVDIGLVDLPEQQSQDPLTLDFASAGNVAVFGAGGSGKTTVLTTTALALASTRSPDDVRIYGIDAGSGALLVIDRLPHCGGAIRVDDKERVHRLLRDLVRRMEHASDGRSDDGSVRRRRTILLLDDLGAFADLHDRPGVSAPFEHLRRILAGGRVAGIHVVFTASRRGAVSPALAAHVGQRLILRMPTYDDYLSLGLDSKRVRGARLAAGRGFTQDGEEFQLAVPVRAGQRLDVATAALEVPSSGRVASRLGILPLTVPRASFGDGWSIDRVPVGISDSDLRPASLDLRDRHCLVVGPYRSGRSTTLSTLAAGLARVGASDGLHLLAPRRSPLRTLELWTGAATTHEACEAVVDSLIEAAGTRHEAESPLFVFIDDGGELADPMMNARLEQLIRVGRDCAIRVIAAVETGVARGFVAPWVRELRKDGLGILLQPDLMSDGDLLGAQLPSRVATPMVPGRGFVVSAGRAELIHVGS